MRLASKIMYDCGEMVYISRYEVINAFLKTEEEENENMAKELNVLLNAFCVAERNRFKSIESLPFCKATYHKVIAYISKL